MIYLHLRNHQPLCIAAEQAQGAVRQSLSYLSGSALRGALAAQLRALQPTFSPAQFATYFLDTNACIQNLYPKPKGAALARPLPATAHTCKLYAGFATKRQPKAKPAHGVRDLLLGILADQQMAGRPLTAQQTEARSSRHGLAQYCWHQAPQAQQCTLPLEAVHRFYAGDQPREYELVDVSRRQITQTAIDPHRETASPANLFSVEVIEEAQEFAGYLRLGAQIDEAAFCRDVCPSGTQLRVGYGRTRGFGLMEVIAAGVDTPILWTTAMQLEERIATFNERAQAQGYDTNGQTLFSVTCLADTILLDPFFRYTTQLDGTLLAQEGYPLLADVQPILTVATTRMIGGWSTPHGLPLQTDLAVTLGSTYVFQSALALDHLLPALAALEVGGIGERRQEGFGQLVVCHPFHQEVNPV